MTAIAGMLNITDADRAFVNVVGQQLIFDAANTYLATVNTEFARTMASLVQMTTENHQERWKLPGGGRLQKIGAYAVAAATKANGSWDVAYPLETFGDQKAFTDITMGYMTLAEFQRQLDDVVIKNINSVRFELLRRLFNNTSTTFTDPINGSLTVQCLANGDSVVYPPVLGSETEATENHYLESNYAASSISDTNNPIVTIVNELEEHFGLTQGGSDIVVFVNPTATEVSKIRALAGFVDVSDRYVLIGSNTADVRVLPNVPGRVIGRTDGAWIVEYPWIPSGYLFGIHLGAPAPLKMRIDPAYTGLGSGLQLMAQEREYPIQSAYYRNRFGFGVANRLNGVVLELGTGGSYTIPTIYA